MKKTFVKTTSLELANALAQRGFSYMKENDSFAFTVSDTLLAALRELCGQSGEFSNKFALDDKLCF